MRYISLDIDGIVNNYPNTMFNFAFEEFNLDVNSKEVLKEKLNSININYSDFKHLYRKKYECVEVVNYDVKVNQDFIDFYKEFQNFSNLAIVFRTSRPESLYPGTLNRTSEWLRFYGIEENIVTNKTEHSFKLYQPLLHIDDEIEHLNLHKTYSKHNQLFLYRPQSEEHVEFGNYKVIKKLTQLCLIIPQLTLM